MREAREAGYLDVLAETPEQALAIANARASEIVALDEKAYLTTKREMRAVYGELLKG